MSPKIHKTQRLLDLVALLVSRHYPLSRGQIWDEVPAYRTRLDEGADPESLRRTFERDKKELLELGFPLQTIEDPRADPAEQQCYRLSHRDFYLPYLRLVKEDRELASAPKSSSTPRADLAPERAHLVAEALHRLRGAEPVAPLLAAESAFRKLTYDLVAPDEAFGPPEVILASDDAEALERVEVLGDAVRRRRRARFTYHSLGRDTVALRRVEPWGLLFKYNRWYLIAHDLDRQARRTFRLSRMQDLEIDADEGAYPEPDIDLTQWTRAEAWSLPGQEGEELTVDVRFGFPRSLWAERNGHGERVADEAGGAAVRRFEVRSADPFLRWLLSFGTEVEVVAPPAMAEQLGRLRARVAALHRGPPGGHEAPGPGGTHDPGGSAGGGR